jgi:hypothetical protein
LSISSVDVLLTPTLRTSVLLIHQIAEKTPSRNLIYRAAIYTLLSRTVLRCLRLLCPGSDEGRESRHSREGPEGG